MRKISLGLFILFYIWVVLVFFLNLTANITFGHGLGDLFILIPLLIISISLSFGWVLILKGKIGNVALIYFIMLLTFCTIIFFTLKLTILRGPEYIWNGNLFLAVHDMELNNKLFLFISNNPTLCKVHIFSTILN